MAFPVGWPPRPCEGRRSIRFYISATTSGAFLDRAYLFAGQAAANPYLPLQYTQPGSNATFTLPGTPTGTGSDPQDSQPLRVPMIWSNSIRIYNDGGAGVLDYSFDGTNVHGQVLAGKEALFRERLEAGIALKGHGVSPTGTVTVVAGALLIDGETVTISNGTLANTFEFDSNAAFTPGNIPVVFNAGSTQAQVRDALILAINTAAYGITAVSGGGGLINLTNTVAATEGNVTITETVVDAGFTVAGFAGGTGIAFRVEAW